MVRKLFGLIYKLHENSWVGVIVLDTDDALLLSQTQIGLKGALYALAA